MKKLLYLAILLIVPQLHAACAGGPPTWTAASTSKTDILACQTLASAGDTINVPPGTATWAGLNITKAITLACVGGTCTINDTSAAFLYTCPTGTTFGRITGFSFTGVGSGNNGDLEADSPSSGFCSYRMDHNSFTNSGQLIGVAVIQSSANATYSEFLIDHNTFTGGPASEMIHELGYGAGNTFGWGTDVNPGDQHMTFVEDNTFTSSPATCSNAYSSAIEAFYGSRTVFRHNTLNFSQVDQHGTAGSVYARWWEVYDNVFNIPLNSHQPSFSALRGGSGVLFSNTQTGDNTSCSDPPPSFEITEDAIVGAYPITDQIGRGISQNASPAYVWGNGSIAIFNGNTTYIQICPTNTSCGSHNPPDVVSSSTQLAPMIKCESAADVTAGCPVSYTYTPYTYPNPLQLPPGPAIVQGPGSSGNFLDCSGGCTNVTMTPHFPTIPGNLLVLQLTSNAPINNVQGGGIWFLISSGQYTESNQTMFVYSIYSLNAPTMSTFTINSGAWSGGAAFYELSGVNAIDQQGLLNTPSPGTSTSATTSISTTQAPSIVFGVLAGAPNTPTLTGSLTSDATLAFNKSIFASAVESSTGTYSMGGTWSSGTGVPTIVMFNVFEATPPTAVPPVLSPGGGRYGASQSVSMYCPNTSCTIHYTTNGTTPTCGSTLYSSPITVSSTATVEALSCIAGYTNSGVNTQLYTITGVTSPTTWYVRPDGGTRYDATLAPFGMCTGKVNAAYPGLSNLQWQPSTTYTLAQIITDNAGHYETVTTGGTSGTSYPTWTGSTTTSGSAVFTQGGTFPVNQGCAFENYKGAYDTGAANNNFWVIQGGDTVIDAGDVVGPNNASGTSRIGWDIAAGGFFYWCIGPGFSCSNPPIPSGVPLNNLTSFAISSGVATIQMTNTLSAGDVVMIGNNTTAAGKAFNGQVFTVLSPGLSSSQFEVLITAPNIGSTSDTGTVARPTRILGVNYATCNSGNQTIKANLTEMFGGFNSGTAMDLGGAQYVEIACLNLTSHGNCVIFGSPALPSGCSTSYPTESDFNANGVQTNNATSNVLMQDLWIHGNVGRGVKGAIGGTVTCLRCNIDTNGSAGWDFDDGTNSAPGPGGGNPNQFGTASIHGQWNFFNSIIQWSGCNQEYPFVHTIPVSTCYGQSNGGYGDGVGSPPGGAVNVYWYQSYCAYNVQDCLDIGHADAGSSGSGYNDQTSVTFNVQSSYAFGNSGGNWKSGPNANPVIIQNTIVIGNCSRLSAAITGVPSAFNANLGDFCRSGTAIGFNYHAGGVLTYSSNTMVTYFQTTDFVSCWEGDAACPGTTFNFQNNIIYGLQNPTQSYNGNNGGIGGILFGNPGIPTTTVRTNNQWFGVRTVTCPSGFTAEICTDVLFLNEPAECLVEGGAGCTFTEATWDPFLSTFLGGPSTPDYNLTNVSPAIGAGTAYTGPPAAPTVDYAGNAATSPPVIGALNFGTTTTVATPTALPVAGSYATTQNVALSTLTSGATICYRTDGINPAATTPGTCDAGSTTYTTTITVSVSTTILAIGTKAADINSSVASFAYTITGATNPGVHISGRASESGRVTNIP